MLGFRGVQEGAEQVRTWEDPEEALGAPDAEAFRATTLRAALIVKVCVLQFEGWVGRREGRGSPGRWLGVRGKQEGAWQVLKQRS